MGFPFDTTNAVPVSDFLTSSELRMALVNKQKDGAKRD